MHATSLVLASVLCSAVLAAPQPAPYIRGGFALGNNKLGAREPLSNSNDFAKPAYVNNKPVGLRRGLDTRLSNSNDFAKPAFVNNKKVGVRHAGSHPDKRLSNSNDFAKPAYVNDKKVPRQDSGIQCAPVDDDGTALTGSAGSGDFVTCTYAGAGLCAYFPADGSFSSGGSSCPQGVAQDPSATCVLCSFPFSLCSFPFSLCSFHV
ncbi:hypothetical protein C8R43DRAFT_507093 [Mycena crocata]|nr:hypothetical protein C8R43DRAFT_507093 [Mycena crocata]